MISFKNTEAGTIPEDWGCEIVEKIIDEISMGPFGSDIKVENFVSEGVPVLNGPCVASIELSEVYSNYLTRKKAESLKKANAHRGDIIVTHRGTIGQVSFIPEHSKYSTYIISQSQFRVHFKESVLLPYFVVAYLLSPVGQKKLLEKRGYTGVPALAQATTNFRRLSIPIPSLPEQKAIASALSDIDELIANLEKLIGKKKNIKQGAMQELITGKKRLPGFDGEWQIVNMSKNSKIKARIGWQGLTTAEYLDDGYSYLVTGTDFLNGKIRWETCHFVTKERFDQDENIQIKNGDVLITKDGTIGKVAMVEDLKKPATLNSGVFVVRPTTGIFTEQFLYYVLLSNVFKSFIKELMAGSTIIHLYQKDIVKFNFSVPPTIEEQKAISAFLYDMDIEIDTLETKLRKLRLIKQGMMQKLLTGEIRLI